MIPEGMPGTIRPNLVLGGKDVALTSIRPCRVTSTAIGMQSVV